MAEKSLNYHDDSTQTYSRGGDSSVPAEAIPYKPIEVKIVGNNFERALKAFRAIVQKEKVISLYKKKQVYEKPSDKKRRKRDESNKKRFEMDMQRKDFSQR